MGTIVELSGVGLASAVLITDNPLYPCFHADLRLFTGGFLIERIDKSPLPLLISIKSHVEVMWSVDMGEAYTHGLRSVDLDDPRSTSSELLDGIFIILKLRTDFSDAQSTFSGYEKCIQYDMWNRIFPAFFSTSYIGLLIPSNSRTIAPFTSAHFSWRNFARMYDIPDIRGLKGNYAIPDALLLSYLIALNQLSLTTVHSLSDDSDEMDDFLLQGYLFSR